jgi:gluconokinase
MGVSGSGKSTVADLIANRTGCALAEGDDFHSPASIARMAAGHPLDDTVRAPWLAAIAAWLAQRADRGECAVVSCSALRRTYRDVLPPTQLTDAILSAFCPMSPGGEDLGEG